MVRLIALRPALIGALALAVGPTKATAIRAQEPPAMEWKTTAPEEGRPVSDPPIRRARPKREPSEPMAPLTSPQTASSPRWRPTPNGWPSAGRIAWRLVLRRPEIFRTS